MTYELGQLAIKGLLNKTGLSPKMIDSVIMGCVLTLKQVLQGKLHYCRHIYSTPCHTVSQACISANRAIASAIGEIATGQSSVVIAGGADSASETQSIKNK